MDRRGMVAVMLGALGAVPRHVFAQVSAEGRQYDRKGFFVFASVREQTLVSCGSSDERRERKQVEVTIRCRELDGAGRGRSVTMRAGLVKTPTRGSDARRFETVDKCRDTFRTTGNVNRVHELRCSLKLPREAR